MISRVGRQHHSLRSAAVLALLVLGCAKSPYEFYASYPRCTDYPPADDPRTDECLRPPATVEYIAHMKQRMNDAWQPGGPPDQRVELWYRIEEDGSLRCVSLTGDSSRTLALSTLVALQDSTPFDPIPEESLCILEIPIRVTFRNPSPPDSATELP